MPSNVPNVWASEMNGCSCCLQEASNLAGESGLSEINSGRLHSMLEWLHGKKIL